MLCGVQTQETYARQYKLNINRELITNEIHKPNDYYGHGFSIKHYCGVDSSYSLKYVLEHGVIGLKEECWDLDMNSLLPGIASAFAHRIKVNHKACSKIPIAIGPLIYYAPPKLKLNNKARIAQ